MVVKKRMDELKVGEYMVGKVCRGCNKQIIVKRTATCFTLRCKCKIRLVYTDGFIVTHDIDPAWDEVEEWMHDKS